MCIGCGSDKLADECCGKPEATASLRGEAGSVRMSDTVRAASLRALERLRSMRKEELDERIANRDIGPLGKLILEVFED